MYTRSLLGKVGLSLLALLWASTAAAVPGFVSVQGVLRDSAGGLTSGSYDMEVKLYDSPTGGVVLHSETHPAVMVQSGAFSLQIGSVTPVDAAVYRDHEVLYLGIQVQGDAEELPRQRILSVPFAIEADHAKSATDVGGLAATQLQRRISTVCPSGEFMTGAGVDGAPSCASPPTLAASAPLSASGSTVSLSACSSGQVLKSNGTGWDCATDDNTSVTATAPVSVSGGNISLSGCGSSEVLKWNGTAWNCATDDNTTYTGTSPVAVTGTSISLSACAGTQVLKWNGSSWACAADDNTTYTGTAPVSVMGTAISLSACSSGEVLKWNGSSWACDSDLNPVYTGTSPIAVSGSAISLSSDGCAAGQVLTWGGASWACAINVPCSGCVANDQVSDTASIAGSKIAPDFGAQDVTTTGSVTTGTLKVTGNAAANRVLMSDGVGLASWTDLDGHVWRLGGNGGTASESHFIGTTDAMSLVFRVNNQVGLVLQPTAGVPNLIGGSGANQVTAGVVGATVFAGASGTQNEVSDDFGTIGGGRGNRAGDGAGTVSDAADATVSGGRDNKARAVGATVAGGIANEATGAYSTTAGGHSNKAMTRGSLAAGMGAVAQHQGAFVWADNSGADGGVLLFGSANTNQFSARATGGVRFVTGVSGGEVGAQILPGSGSWSSISDRDMKTETEAVDAERILDRVASLPIQSWRYKTQKPEIRHIGPMAQDFHAAFGVGEDRRHISTVDADGVALAAIQGLYRKLRRLGAEVESLREQLKTRCR